MRVATLWKAAADGRTPILRDDLPPPLSGDERARVERFLSGGAVIAVATARMADRLDPQRGDAVPLDYRTDGEWLWTGDLVYYLAIHAITPPADLLAHIRRRDYIIAPVDAATCERARAVARGEVAPSA
jgi:hypothetical protein